MNRSPRPSRHFPIRTMLNRGETDVGSHVTARLITYAHSSMTLIDPALQRRIDRAAPVRAWTPTSALSLLLKVGRLPG
jgi:hypothetical protein